MTTPYNPRIGDIFDVGRDHIGSPYARRIIAIYPNGVFDRTPGVVAIRYQLMDYTPIGADDDFEWNLPMHDVQYRITHKTWILRYGPEYRLPEGM